MKIIQRIELSSNTSSITFSSIPQTYTDLILLLSVRSNRATWADDLLMGFNGSYTSMTVRALYGSQTSLTSSSDSMGDIGPVSANTNTSNTFGSTQVHIPNYATSNYKTWSSESAGESNSVDCRRALFSGIWSSTSAITSISIKPYDGTELLAGSSFSLYGILKGNDGITTVS